MTRDHRPAIETVGLGRDYGSTRALDALDLVSPARADGRPARAQRRGQDHGDAAAGDAAGAVTRRRRACSDTTSCASARAIRRRLGLVFQEASVDGLLTVEENLLFAARLVGLGGDDGATGGGRRASSAPGLASRASQPARQLSGGWRRLADIARATVHRPDLLILDEPTVGLDPEHRDRMWTTARHGAPRARHDDPLLHALPGGSRAVRPGRAPRARRVVGRRHADGAQGPGGQRDRRDRGPRRGAAARALRTAATVRLSSRQRARISAWVSAVRARARQGSWAPRAASAASRFARRRSRTCISRGRSAATRPRQTACRSRSVV